MTVGPVTDLTIARSAIEDGLQHAVKVKIQAAVSAIYESLRDLPVEHQTRVLIASAVLLGRADDVVARLTGKGNI